MFKAKLSLMFFLLARWQEVDGFQSTTQQDGVDECVYVPLFEGGSSMVTLGAGSLA